MSDAPSTPNGDEPTPTEMEMPEDVNDHESSKDEMTETTPPHAEEGEQAPEADEAPKRSAG